MISARTTALTLLGIAAGIAIPGSGGLPGPTHAGCCGVAAQDAPEPAATDEMVPVDAALAKALYDRLVVLAGQWSGSSTNGWEDLAEISVIAAGSVVMQVSDFEAHPGERMVTMFHLDGDRLLLTHYCVAKNQPRLVASAASPEGSRVLFTFLDGTNLESRDQGHMDSALFEFVDEDHYTSRWTWYQDGAEGWMEAITMQRRDAAPATRR